MSTHIHSIEEGLVVVQIYREETFGPAVPLFKFKHDEEAVTLANDTIYGLAAYFYTRVRCISCHAVTYSLQRVCQDEGFQLGPCSRNQLSPLSPIWTVLTIWTTCLSVPSGQ